MVQPGGHKCDLRPHLLGIGLVLRLPGNVILPCPQKGELSGKGGNIWQAAQKSLPQVWIWTLGSNVSSTGG